MRVEDVYGTIGDRIRGFREARGLSQAGLADRVSLTRTSITNIERGNQRLLVHTLCEIAASLSIDPRLLLPDPHPDINRTERELPLPDHLSAAEQDWIRAVVGRTGLPSD